MKLAALLVVVLSGLIVIYLFRSETAVDSGWRDWAPGADFT